MLYAFSTDPPLAHTGGFGEPNCTACHRGTVNPAGGSVRIEAPAAYTPGTQYTIRVTISDSDPDRRRWGFELSARFRNGEQAGSFTAAPNVSVRTQRNVQYAAHSPAQTAPGNSFTYEVPWTAPASGANGDVVFNAAGNATNASGNNTGDRVFITEQISAGPSQPPASIGAGGIVNAASFAAAPNNIVAPGALISIFGQNLAAETVSASALPLPTTLSNARVLINGVPAPLIFVSAGQINAQVPFAAQVGTGANASVVVETAGRASNPEQVRVEAVAPGVFTIPPTGSGRGAILRANTATVIGAEAPARPGEIIEIYLTGLGQTTPPLVSGAAGAAQNTNSVPTVTIGGQAATVRFSGAAPCCAGLYQVNVVVPNVAAGDHPLVIQADQRSSQTGVTVRVQP